MSDMSCICVDVPYGTCLLHGKTSGWRTRLVQVFDRQDEPGEWEDDWDQLWDQFDQDREVGASAQADLGLGAVA